MVDKLLGSQLLQQKHLKPTKALLRDKEILALYYGAHWAPPCRVFTERLIEFYEQIDLVFANFGVVFISDDGNEEHFERNYALMPWFALPYNEEEIKLNLKKQSGINGIPNLQILAVCNGRTI